MTWQNETKEVSFGRSNSPLITDKLVIVPGGGKKGEYCSLIAYDKVTGEERWRGGNQQISYSSPVMADLLKQKQILIVNEATVSGHNPGTGVKLWSYPWPGNSNRDANVSQVVPLTKNRLLLSKGYREGATVIELSRPALGKPIQVKKIWSNSRVLLTKFTNVVIWQGYAYGLSNGILECVDLATGKRSWKQGRYGNGQILRVKNMLLVLSERGKLSLVQLSPTKTNDVKGNLQALNGKTWNNLALYENKLLLRNATEAVCYELNILKE